MYIQFTSCVYGDTYTNTLLSEHSKMASHKKKGTDVTENVTMCDSVQRDSSEQGGK